MPHAVSTEPLVQMMQSISLQKRTGLLKVERLGERGNEQGEIYFEGGNPIRVRTRNETGKEALRLISSWKQITCSFNGMSRTYPGNVPVLPAPKERETAKEPAVHTPAATRQSGDLTRAAQSFSAERSSSGIHAPLTPLPELSAPERSRITRPITPADAKVLMAQSQIAQSNISANAKTPISPIPVAPIPGTQTNQRWMTQPSSENRSPVMFRKPPVTPRLGLTNDPGNDFLPGRQGVFRARSMANTMKSIQQMERRERITYVLLDGHRTIQDIARLTHRPEGEVEQTLLQLAQRGYIEYIGRQQSLPTTNEKMANLLRNQRS